jgi:hypothetical protein
MWKIALHYQPKNMMRCGYTPEAPLRKRGLRGELPIFQAFEQAGQLFGLSVARFVSARQFSYLACSCVPPKHPIPPLRYLIRVANNLLYFFFIFFFFFGFTSKHFRDSTVPCVKLSKIWFFFPFVS